jgi:hypothetical protein
MNAETRLLSRLTLLALLALVACVPILAQQDSVPPPPAPADAPATEEEDVRGKIIVQLGVWAAQPQGLEYRPATVNRPTNLGGADIVELEHDTTTGGRFRAGYRFGHDVGALILTYFSHSDQVTAEEFTNGEFIWGELLAHPLFAGYENNGLGDGYQAGAETKLRDFRIDFYRTAFRSRRIDGKWFFGIRRVDHDRSLFAQYSANLPGLPPLIPPASFPDPNLTPVPDTAQMRSNFSGRGIEVGLDVDVPLWKDKLLFESGVALAVLRGEIDTFYQSTTHFFTTTISGTEEFLLPPDYDLVFGTAPETITQEEFLISLSGPAQSRTATVLDTFFGLRFWPFAWFSAFIDFRMTHYDNVGLDLRQVNSEHLFGINLVDVEQTDRSVVYEGFEVGITFRF